ncbi:MAG: O-antigen ligase family protein [Gemmobacter sp.]
MEPLRRILPQAMLGAGVALAGAALLVAGAARFSAPVAGVVAAAVLLGLAIVIHAPGLTYVLMALVVPLERVGRFGGDLDLQTFSLMRLVGMLALAAVFAQMLIRRQALEMPRGLVLYGLIVAMAFGSILYAADPLATRSHALTMLGNLLMLFVLVQGVRDWTMIERLVLAWIFATVLIGIYQVYDWHFKPAARDGELGIEAARLSTTWIDLSERSTLGEIRRAMGTTSSAAVYGINLLLALPFLFLYLRLAQRTLVRLLWIAAIGIVSYNILLTNTRAVLVFFAFLVLLIAATGLFRLTLYNLIGAALAGVAVLVYLPSSIWERVLNRAAYDLSNATNLSWRFELWAAALRLGTDNWLTGIGVGNRTAIIAYLDPTRFEAGWIMAHNEFLQVFYELGILGLALFLVFLATMLWRALVTASRLRAAGQEARAWFAVASFLSLLIGIVFSVQVDAFHFPLKGWWLVAGLILVADRLSLAETAARRTGTTPEQDRT